jgi:hypothetical protein
MVMPFCGLALPSAKKYFYFLRRVNLRSVEIRGITLGPKDASPRVSFGVLRTRRLAFDSTEDFELAPDFVPKQVASKWYAQMQITSCKKSRGSVINPTSPASE